MSVLISYQVPISDSDNIRHIIELINSIDRTRVPCKSAFTPFNISNACFEDVYSGNTSTVGIIIFNSGKLYTRSSGTGKAYRILKRGKFADISKALSSFTFVFQVRVTSFNTI